MCCVNIFFLKPLVYNYDNSYNKIKHKYRISSTSINLLLNKASLQDNILF